MLNLIGNAIDAMREVPAEARLLIVRTRDVEGGDLQVEIEDRGAGIDEAAADRLFDHLFTTKGRRHGTGTGDLQVHR